MSSYSLSHLPTLLESLQGLLSRDRLAAEGTVSQHFLCGQVKRGRKTITRRELVSLRRVKDDVKEVSAGNECGLRLTGFDEFEEGDSIIALEIVQARRSLEEAADLHARAASAAREPVAA